MSDKKPTISEVFNEIANSVEKEPLQKALDKIELLSKEDKRVLIDELEQALLEDMKLGIPKLSELEEAMFLKQLASSLGMPEDSLEDEKDAIRTVQAMLLVVDKVIAEKKENTHPMLKSVVEEVKAMSDENRNDFLKLMFTISETVDKHSNPSSDNNGFGIPFKDRSFKK